ncbi:MAG: hypothetical protein IT440_11540 [Phycisphaeraceae bacterium]|nr:hypothetical protein [Phycisphaeraceae bacterium]
MNEKEAKRYLAAFADGELDIEQNLRVLAYVNMDRAAATRVAHQQQLREWTGRAMREMTPAMPAWLVEQLGRIGESDAADPGYPRDVPRSSSGVQEQNDTPPGNFPLDYFFRGRGWSRGWAVAAVLALCALTIFASYLRSPGVFHPINTTTSTTLVSDSLVEAMIQRHRACIESLDRLHSYPDGNPLTIEDASLRIGEELGRPVYANMALDGAGYQFVKAGPCSLPGPHAAHVMYRGGDARTGSLSLWMCADDRPWPLSDDQPVTVRGEGSPHPILAWRHQGMLYFLVGDSYPGVQRAYQALCAGCS